MTPELKSKFVQHLNHKKNDAGFTLVELLVVIVIIGILGAIAIPNFLNQDVKAKQAEAKQNVALFNKTQNSYRAEVSQFASSFNLLAIGSVTDNVSAGSGTTTNYTYIMTGAIDTTSIIAQARDGALKGYAGGDARFSNSASMSVIGTVMCEVAAPGTAAPGGIAFTAGSAPDCTTGQRNLSL
jgi:type IV pilus assembly protein PilA